MTKSFKSTFWELGLPSCLLLWWEHAVASLLTLGGEWAAAGIEPPSPAKPQWQSEWPQLLQTSICNFRWPGHLWEIHVYVIGHWDSPVGCYPAMVDQYTVYFSSMNSKAFINFLVTEKLICSQDFEWLIGAMHSAQVADFHWCGCEVRRWNIKSTS